MTTFYHYLFRFLPVSMLRPSTLLLWRSICVLMFISADPELSRFAFIEDEDCMSQEYSRIQLISFYQQSTDIDSASMEIAKLQLQGHDVSLIKLYPIKDGRYTFWGDLELYKSSNRPKE